MPRKKRVTGKPREIGKTRVELRFDSDLYEEVKQLADEAEISVNQLLQGITRWAMKYAHAGEASFDGSEVNRREQPGCVWFGHDGVEYTDDEGQPSATSPELYFNLDFTERHVVKEDIQARGQGA